MDFSGGQLGRRSAGATTIIPVVGHPTKQFTSEKWARQAQRRGLGTIIDHLLCWHGDHVLVTHRDRELREIEDLQFQIGGRRCDVAHEHADHAEIIAGGPQMRTLQFIPTLRRR